MDISNKVAVVTGGASGLGEATVRAYVAKGGKVAIFDMNAERGNAIVAELGEDKVAFFNVNVADEESVQNAVNAVMDKFGAIHICNNYAGIGSAAKTLSKNGPFPFAEYTKIINVNLSLIHI